MYWYHYSANKFLNKDSLYDLPSYNHKSFPYKPSGLWLALENEWYKLQTEIGDEKFLKKLKYKYQVKIKPDSPETKLLVISCIQDLIDFDQKYKLDPEEYENPQSIKDFYYDEYGPTFPEWQRVCEEYDAIIFLNHDSIITNEYIMPEKYKIRYHWWYFLDINSACIWRPSKVISEINLM
jgi:hypothetical protein